MNKKVKAPVRFRDKVKATKAYKDLGKIQKSIYTTGQNMRALENSFTLIQNIGLDKWKKVAQNSHVNALIIQELYSIEQSATTEILTPKTA